MTDLRYDFEVHINAPLDTVFEYCRDPRRIYAGDPTHEVVEDHVVAEGVGTTARVKARTGPFDEDIKLEYVELVPDEKIVFDAHPRSTLRWLDRFVIPGARHSWTLTFTRVGKGTRLTLLVVEHDAPRWERLMDALTLGTGSRMFAKEISGRLSRLKAATERQAAPARGVRTPGDSGRPARR